jgi:hypothetical protein
MMCILECPVQVSDRKLAEELYFLEYTKVVRKIRFPMIFHNEKHVYWH